MSQRRPLLRVLEVGEWLGGGGGRGLVEGLTWRCATQSMADLLVAMKLERVEGWGVSRGGGVIIWTRTTAHALKRRHMIQMRVRSAAMSEGCTTVYHVCYVSARAKHVRPTCHDMQTGARIYQCAVHAQPPFHSNWCSTYIGQRAKIAAHDMGQNWSRADAGVRILGLSDP